MNIQNAQETVDQWIKTHGVRYFNELTNMAQLSEEVGEVARIIARRYGEQSEKESAKDQDEYSALDKQLKEYLLQKEKAVSLSPSAALAADTSYEDVTQQISLQTL